MSEIYNASWYNDDNVVQLYPHSDILNSTVNCVTDRHEYKYMSLLLALILLTFRNHSCFIKYLYILN
jgi:hypothetical protein